MYNVQPQIRTGAKIRHREELATIRPELMDACLDWMAGIHLHRRLLAALVILLGSFHEIASRFGHAVQGLAPGHTGVHVVHAKH